MGEQGGRAIGEQTYTLDSDLDSVDNAEKTVLGAAREVGMAVREAMVNAVVHGNRYNLKKKVHLLVQRGSAGILIRITDEGEGFDLTDIPDPLAEENLLRQSGRGLLLIQAFVDEFRMTKVPPKGTEVTIVKNLKRS
jgi:serine/threonine-protein kinase RsbW